MGSRESLAVAEWKANWPLVLACAIGFSLATVPSQTIGLFMEPLQRDLGLSRANITLGVSLAALSSIVLSPLAGVMIDRWGSRWLAIPGLIMTAAALACFGLAQSSTQWIGLWLLYALVSMGVKITVWMTAASKAFVASRGLALAFVIAGSAFAGIVAPPWTNWLIETFGWREAFLYLGLSWGLPALLLTVFFLHEGKRRPRMAGELPEPAVAEPAEGLSMAEAMRDGALWRIAIATFIFMAFASIMTVHQVPILIEAGISRGQAALLASAAAVAGFAGKIVTGWLMDRMHAARISGLTVACCSLAFALFVDPMRSPAGVVVAVLIIGYTGGAKMNVVTYLTGRYGGLRNFGKIYGVMGSVIALGTALGPLGAAATFDHSGSYSPFLIAGIPAGLIAGALMFTLGPYPVWERRQALSRWGSSFQASR